MEQINSNATYDILSIAQNLEKYNTDFNYSEINMFCYFACVLSLYEGEQLSHWGYSFLKNKFGVPISSEIQFALQQALELGHLIKYSDIYYNISQKGLNFLNRLNSIPRYQKRKIFIENACNSLLINPIGNIREMLNKDPVISNVKEHSLTELLNESSGTTELLYKQFAVLKKVIKKEISEDLFIVANSWLKCIQNIREFGYANE